MKCDHLIGRTFDGDVYILASDVMEAIAELKADYHAEVEEVCVEKTNVDTLEQALKEKDKALGEKDALLNDFREMQRQLAEKCGRLEDAIDKKDNEIAELKKKLMPCLNGDCILTCEVVEKYGKENAELKAKLEDAKATTYAESVDAGMRERRLKRALYKACANWAHEKDDRYYLKYVCISDDARIQYERWRKMERKCQAKAEEYK